MQRIVPFGRTARYSDPFTLDEGQTIGLWLVRTDSTDSVGAASAEVQIKSYDGAGTADDNLWTTVYRLSTEKPYQELKGTDEDITFRVLVKANSYAAVDSSLPSGSQTRTQKAPVTVSQSNFDNATRAVSGKALAADDADNQGAIGFFYDYRPTGAISPNGVLFPPRPSLSGAPGSDSYFSITARTANDELFLAIYEDVSGGGVAATDWNDYVGGSWGIASECPSGTLSVLSFPITAGDVNANGIDTQVISPAAKDRLAPGNTFFYFIAKPGQAVPTFNLGPKTGRFTLDQNDFPARLSAWPFNTDDERVTLFAVEAGIPIPITYPDTTPAELHSGYAVYTIDAPGQYEWRRSCNFTGGVYLSTGWNTP